MTELAWPAALMRQAGLSGGLARLVLSLLR
jgi:hypothetical protein